MCYIKIKVSPRFEGIFFTKTHVEIKTKGKQSKNERMKKGKKGSSGKWSDRVVCVVSMLPDEEGKQLKQQVQRITTNESIVLLSREKQPKQQVQRITTISISHA